MANFAKPPVLLLALIALILNCTSITQVESTPSSNSSHPSPPSNIDSPPSSQVPEWFENCVLHLVYLHHPKDVLVNRKPFTSEWKNSEGCTLDDRVRRCWDDETQALAFPITPFCHAEEEEEVFPPKASPWLLQSLRSLVDKGHVKPFSMFEVKSRVHRSLINLGMPLETWTLQAKLLSFMSALHGSSVTEAFFDLNKLPQPCRDYHCDLDSNEYWFQLFNVFRRCCWIKPIEYTATRGALPRVPVHRPKLYKYGIPIPYRPPPFHL